MTRWVALSLFLVASLAAAGADPCPRCARYAAPDGAAVLLPDPTLTPGTFDPKLTKAEACKPERLRKEDGRNVPDSRKAEVFAAYGIRPKRGQYEIDHRCPIKLCGRNDAANLWPQPYLPWPGAHEKDVLELKIIGNVCRHGTMTLAEGQRIFLGNWYDAYLQYVPRR